MSDAARVRITREGNLARIFSPDYLGPDLWPRFRRAIDGARFVREKRANLATLDKIHPMIVRLREAGFAVSMDADVTRGLQRYTAEQLTHHQQAKERIERIDAEMRSQTGKFLFNYQKFGAMWLSQRRAALLADEQGTGKTLQALCAFPTNAPVIICCPATLKDTWRSEARKFRPQLKLQVLAGRDSFRWPKEGEFLIINFDVLPDVHDTEGVAGRRCEGFLPPDPCDGCREEWVMTPDFMGMKKVGHLSTCKGFKEPLRCPGCHPLLTKSLPGTVLVADEAQKIKGATSSRALRFRALSDAVRARDGRTWVLTGTPMENNPKELWYVLKAAGVAEECFGDFKTFFEVFKGKPLDHGGCTWGLPDDEVVERLQRGALRRMRRDVLPELPSKMHQVLEVEVNKAALGPADAFMKRYGGIDAITSLIEKESFDFTEMSAALKALATAKIPQLLKVVKEFEEHKEPLVVFSMHRAPIDAVEKLPGWAAIHGGIPVEDRYAIVEKFQEGKLKGLGLVIQSAGFGLTLTRSARGIFVDQSWKPTENEQAEDRLVRIGQTRGVVFTILTADHPLDRRKTEILMSKRELIAAAVDASSVVEGAPVDVAKEFEDQLRAIQQEITGGKVVRRFAVTEEEEQALRDLQTSHFARRGDEKLAEDLVEQASAIGLSNAQWILATRVAVRGAKKHNKSLDDTAAVGHNSDPSSANSEQSTERMQDGEGEEGSDMGTDGQVRDQKVDDVLALIRDMAQESRCALFALLGDEEEFCLGCGLQGTGEEIADHECDDADA